MKLAGNGSAAKEVSQYTMQTTSSKLSANHGLLKPCSPLLGGRVTVYTAAKQEEEEEVCMCVGVEVDYMYVHTDFSIHTICHVQTHVMYVMTQPTVSE